ncbi:MAG: TonB family protein [Myxococcales bacterium]|nr:TonB family protein [Myxococcales bacterium]
MKPLIRRCRWALVLAVLPFLMGAGGDSDFWGELARPGHKEFARQVALGLKAYRRADYLRKSRVPTVRQQAVEKLREAQRAFDAACKASPENPTGHYYRGKVLLDFNETKKALAALLQVRRLNPLSQHAYDVAFNLGIIYSKLGKFAAAVDEYDRAARLLRKGAGTRYQRISFLSTIQSNAAESLMAIGRLDEAIQRYREATKTVSNNTLAWYGLAVALDRDEQASKALEAMHQAVRRDTRDKVLRGFGVFFIPRGDIYYYDGLAALVRNKPAAAKTAFKRFLVELPKSKWAYRAKQHLRALGAHHPTARRRRRLAPTPSGINRRSPAQVRSAIRYRIQSGAAKIRACYQKELRKDRRLSGTMRVSFVVTKAGQVRNVKLVHSTLESRPRLVACVLRVIRSTSLKRSKPSRTITMTYPFEFKPY